MSTTAIQTTETALASASANLQFLAGRPTETSALAYGMALVAYDAARAAHDAAIAAEMAGAR